MGTVADERRRVTLRDVAELAQVSRATASLVLRDTGNLSDETRARVRAAMDELGYVYNRGAAALRAQRSGLIGVIVPDVSENFTAEFTMGVEDALLPQGIVSLVSNSGDDRDRQQTLLRHMRERQVDGVIIIPAGGTAGDLSVHASRIPIVTTNRIPSDVDIPQVGIDNINGARIAAEHLLTHDVRSVTYVGGLQAIAPRLDRLEGLRDILDPNGITLHKGPAGSPTGQWARTTMRQIIADDALTDAIVCHNDDVAFGVYRALRELAPDRVDEVCVVSFDDIAAASLFEPPLTTVVARGEEVGRLAAEVLTRQLANPGSEPERIHIPPHLKVRRSCGCPEA